jgi:hypothetical protein
MPNRFVIILLALCAVVAVLALSISGTNQLPIESTTPPAAPPPESAPAPQTPPEPK